MSIAVLDEADHVLAIERTREPRGDGHKRDVALARLRDLLSRLGGLREAPVQVSGYCYEHTGVHESFTEAGWTVVASKALNAKMLSEKLPPIKYRISADYGEISVARSLSSQNEDLWLCYEYLRKNQLQSQTKRAGYWRDSLLHSKGIRRVHICPF
jgi:hypothetical protein